jgi:hypothetical protein
MLERARRSLEGLLIGDASGERFMDSSWHLVWMTILLALLASGCVTNSVPMPTRMVADPVTLPQEMGTLSFAVAGRGREIEIGPIDAISFQRIAWAFGISDNMALTNLTWLSYAVIEDRDRETGEGRAPFALALNGGLLGVGFSSVESFIATPGVGVTAIARTGRLRFAAHQTFASQVSALRVTPFSVTDVDGMLQIADRVALGIRASASFHVAPRDSEYALETTLGLRAAVRPRHWVSLHLEGTVVRSAEWTDPSDTPPRPDSPPPPPSHTVQWSYPVWLGAAVHW